MPLPSFVRATVFLEGEGVGGEIVYELSAVDVADEVNHIEAVDYFGHGYDGVLEVYCYFIFAHGSFERIVASEEGHGFAEAYLGVYFLGTIAVAKVGPVGTFGSAEGKVAEFTNLSAGEVDGAFVEAVLNVDGSEGHGACGGKVLAVEVADGKDGFGIGYRKFGCYGELAGVGVLIEHEGEVVFAGADVEGVAALRCGVGLAEDNHIISAFSCPLWQRDGKSATKLHKT